MDKETALKIAYDYAKALREKLDCLDIFLFGSYSRGGYHDESDIDIAVIFPEFDNLIDMQLALMRISRKIDSRIEPYPIRASDFNIANPLAYEIIQYGQRI